VSVRLSSAGTVTGLPYHDLMAFDLPKTLSPSKVSTFTDCALSFRFSAVERLPEPPSIAAERGTLVHRALEHLYVLTPSDRTPDAAAACLDQAALEAWDDPDVQALGLDDAGKATFQAEAAEMTQRIFMLEDPTRVNAVGLELRMETELAGTRLRGIIDRLELTTDGELVVTDYKTGRPPSERYEQSKLGGVHLYSLLCERVLGRRPARVQLLFLGKNPQAIIATPSEQSTKGLERRVGAIWTAVVRACEHEDFRPKPGPLCNWCAFAKYCPTQGGDPAQAAVELGSKPTRPS
jgi:putative RecB family exonuclease